MKKHYFLIIITFFSALASIAQVAINADGTTPDNSAMLDVKSTTRGMLVPRMKYSQRDGISNPARGLLIFCTDDNQYYTNKGTPAAPNWVMVSSQWISNGSNIYYNSGNVGIGEPNPAYPLNFGGTLGSKISLFGNGANHYGIGIQDYQFQVYTDAATSDVTFGYGSSAAFTETVRIKGTGNVGIGTSSPNAPLGFAPVLGKKITLYHGYAGDYGFGIGSGRLQIYSEYPYSDVAIGYDDGGTFGERFAVKTTGALALSGDMGTAGQTMHSGGTGEAHWDFPVKTYQWALESGWLPNTRGNIMAKSFTTTTPSTLIISAEAGFRNTIFMGEDDSHGAIYINIDGVDVAQMILWGHPYPFPEFAELETASIPNRMVNVEAGQHTLIVGAYCWWGDLALDAGMASYVSIMVISR